MTEVYFADVTPLCDGGRYERVAAMLSAERAGKAAACRLERDRQLSAGAGYLLSLALAGRGIAEASAEYVYGEFGRPCLAGHGELSFSLSHSGQMAMCAVSDGEVGCDIESAARHNIAAAGRFFHPGEYRHIIGSPDPEGEFVRLWTLKESYIKALGRGLGMPLTSFEIIPSIPPTVRGVGGFYFTEFRVGGYLAAVCAADSARVSTSFVDLGVL